MNIVEAISLAFAGLYSNRLRSMLTMLGIMIGVSAVILLVAVGNGTSIQVQQQVQGLGTNILYVNPSNAKSGGVSQGFGSGQTLSQADVDAINSKAACPDVVVAVPLTQAPGILTYNNQNYFAPTYGTAPDFPQVRGYDIAEGAFFTQADMASDHRVAVVGQTVIDNLFAGADPVGQAIKINRQTFTVIGRFAAKGSTGLGNQDNIVAIPITAAWAYLQGGRNKNIQQIAAEATGPDSVDKAKQEITSLLLNRHRISDPTQADFTVISQQDIANTYGQITGALTVLLGSIAGISLVVGGIGIMNIMLVTVTERTREIGIRKAIGARRRDILMQFLIESMFLSGVGGILGIVVGALGAAELPRLPIAAGLPQPVVTAPSVLLAFGVSVGIGLFFGIYPANRAAGLNPIEALRYE